MQCRTQPADVTIRDTDHLCAKCAMKTKEKTMPPPAYELRPPGLSVNRNM